MGDGKRDPNGAAVVSHVPMNDRPMVYVAGPYTSNPGPNVNAAIEVGEWMWASGLVTPVVPHLSILWDIVSPRDPQQWYDYDMAFLARSDALFRMAGESIGADREVVFAKKSGIPVFTDPSDLLDWASMVQCDD